jgi:hypothetical protein
MKSLKFILVGFIFGIVLTKSEAVSWYRIYEMFMFQSFHMVLRLVDMPKTLPK